VVSAHRISLLPPWAFGILGFLAQGTNFLLANNLAKAGIDGSVTIAIQFAWVAAILLFVFLQIYHRNTTRRHIVSLIVGSLLFFIVLTPLYEFVPNIKRPGMLAVGVASLALLVLWKRKALREQLDRIGVG